MKYAVEMGSGAMKYILNFVKIGSGIQILIGKVHTQHGDRISLLPFFQNRGSRLKIKVGVCNQHAVCVPVYPPLLIFECIINVCIYHGT
jgi:hypothetical protein